MCIQICFNTFKVYEITISVSAYLVLSIQQIRYVYNVPLPSYSPLAIFPDDLFHILLIALLHYFPRTCSISFL